MNTILTDQNEVGLLRLLKAQRVSYTAAKRIQNFEWIVQVISLLAPIIGVLALSKEYQQYAVVLGTLFTIIYVGMYFFGKYKTIQGAKLQEQFDNQLFGLVWNNYLCGEKVDTNELLKLAKTYTKDDLKDWYSKEIHSNVDKGIAVLLCQTSNLVWDSDLRKLFVTRLLWSIILYVLIFIVYLIRVDKSFTDSLLFFVPIIPSLVYLLIHIVNQYDIIRNKKELKSKIELLFEKYKKSKTTPSEEELRSIQNCIYMERSKPDKIHNWFYRFTKKSMEKDMDEYIKTLIAEYHLEP